MRQSTSEDWMRRWQKPCCGSFSSKPDQSVSSASWYSVKSCANRFELFSSQCSSAKGQSHSDAPGIWLRGVPGRRGRWLRYQNHEHDQVVRQADSSKQSFGSSEEPRRRREYFHWKSGSRGRREAALRYILSLRSHPADAENHARPRDRQQQGLRLHQLCEFRGFRRCHGRDERSIFVQSTHQRVLRVQERLEGRETRISRREIARRSKPTQPQRSTSSALRRRPRAADDSDEPSHHAAVRSTTSSLVSWTKSIRLFRRLINNFSIHRAGHMPPNPPPMGQPNFPNIPPPPIQPMHVPAPPLPPR